MRTFPPAPTEDWRVDVLTGGFPCQDVSNAGNCAGIEAERSGLFRQALRVAGVLRPTWILLENVAALLGRGMGTVIAELAALGYVGEWHCLPAAAFGAVHIRDRVFIMAHRPEERLSTALLAPRGFSTRGYGTDLAVECAI